MRIQLILQHFLTHGAVGLYAEADGGLEYALRDLRALVGDTWMPGLDPVTLVDVIAQAVRGRPRTGSPAMIPSHPTLRFAPLGPVDLVDLARRTDASSTIEEMQSVVARELQELEAAARKHEDARSADWLALVGAFENAPVGALRRAREREALEWILAAHRLDYAARAALSVYPPFAIFEAAGLALSVLGGAPELIELRTYAGGNVAEDVSSYRRALLGAALGRLRRAGEAAFPGLYSGGLPAPKRRVKMGVRPSRSAASEPGSVVDAVTTVDWVADLRRRVEASGALSQVEQSLDLGAPLVDVEQAERRASEAVALLDRVRFLSESPAEQRAIAIGHRAEWYRRWLYTNGTAALSSLAPALRGHPLFEIWCGAVGLGGAVFGLPGDGADESAYAGFEHLRASAHFAIGQLAQSFHHFWGLRGGMDTLIAAIGQRLEVRAPVFGAPPRGAPPYDGWVTELARRLAPTGFGALAVEYRTAARAFHEGRSGADAADARVGLWDRLNIVTSSEAERQGDAWRAYEREQGARSTESLSRLRDLLSRELVRFPIATLFFRLSDLSTAVGALRLTEHWSARGRKMRKRYKIHLREEARIAIACWIRDAQTVFGPLLSPGQWLERYFASELVG